MYNVKITAAQESSISFVENAWLIVHADSVVGVYENREQARKAKSSEGIPGKIVSVKNCEFEILDQTAPDEAISEADEAELAAELDAEETEEVIVLTKREPHDPAPGESAKVLLDAVKKPRGRNEKQIAAQTESKKLPRQIACITTGEEFKTAFAMYTAKPDWLTMTQRNKLTKTLFAAAKIGEKVTVEINGRHFQLVEV